MKYFIAAALIIFYATEAAAQCTQDTHCKNGRICMPTGLCALPPNVCGKDTDCPGDLVCGQDRVCVDSNASLMTSPPPAAVQSQVSPVQDQRGDTVQGSHYPSREQGFTYALRLAYGLPFGKVAGRTALSKNIKGIAVPIALELGYRIKDTDALFATFAYGISQTHCKDYTTSTPNADVKIKTDLDECESDVVRWGLLWTHHFPMAQKFVPWMGLGFGYERQSSSFESDVSVVDANAGLVSKSKLETNQELAGYEVANLSAGADWPIGPFHAGPFLTWTAGRYREVSAQSQLRDGKANTPYQSRMLFESQQVMHHWVLIGARASFN